MSQTDNKRAHWFHPADTEAMETIDAMIFSGDACAGDHDTAIANRAFMLEQIERWRRGITEHAKAAMPDALEDYVIAIFDDGRAFWCKTEDAGDSKLVASNQALIRFEVRMDVPGLVAERDRVQIDRMAAHIIERFNKVE